LGFSLKTLHVRARHTHTHTHTHTHNYSSIFRYLVIVKLFFRFFICYISRIPVYLYFPINCFVNLSILYWNQILWYSKLGLSKTLLGNINVSISSSFRLDRKEKTLSGCGLNSTLQILWSIWLINQKKEFFILTNQKMFRSICSIKWIVTSRTASYRAKLSFCFLSVSTR